MTARITDRNELVVGARYSLVGTVFDAGVLRDNLALFTYAGPEKANPEFAEFHGIKDGERQFARYDSLERGATINKAYSVEVYPAQ
jgi:hypothetical protein